jgi:hypothetical protein
MIKKAVAAAFLSAGLLVGVAPVAGAQPLPPDRPAAACNQGTANAHQTVPPNAEGNHRAHAVIPHC